MNSAAKVGVFFVIVLILAGVLIWQIQGLRIGKGHAQRISEPPLQILRAIPELVLLPLPDADQCCGQHQRIGAADLIEMCRHQPPQGDGERNA